MPSETIFIGARPAAPPPHDAVPNFDRRIRRFIWIYFFLLLFEGALRKWLVPHQLSAPLAIIRDPLLIYIYWLAFRSGKLPTSAFVVTCGVLAVLCFLAGLIPDRNTVFVDLFGARTDFLHMPFIFLVPKFFSSRDVVNMGKWCLILIIPISFLMAEQFLSPEDAFINKASSDEASQMTGGSGRVRPPGPFTFATGAAEFSALCAVFVIYATMFPRTYPRTLLLGGGVGLVAAMAISISRLNLSYVAMVVLCLLFFNALRPGFFPRFIPVAILGAIAMVFLLQLPAIQKGIDTFSKRITDASAYEDTQGGFIGRVTSLFTQGFGDRLWQGPIEGHGLGMGTNAGARLLTGKDSYLLAEGEWQRITLESGPVLGIMFLAWRVLLALWLLRRSLSFAYWGRPLPLLLFGAALPLVVLGQLGRPTTLGFTVLDAGLCLAAMNNPATVKIRPIKPRERGIFRPRHVPGAASPGTA